MTYDSCSILSPELGLQCCTDLVWKWLMQLVPTTAVSKEVHVALTSSLHDITHRNIIPQSKDEELICIVLLLKDLKRTETQDLKNRY